MTAEVAIINRLAVTLAADSAVTLTVGNFEKVYQSVDKIFELCSSPPIGLMIYNNVDFVGIPIEVLAKKYRDQGQHDYKTVFDCGQAFIRFLEKEVKLPEETAHEDVGQKVTPVYQRIYQQFMRRAQKLLERATRAGKKPDTEKALPELFNEETRRAFEQFTKLPNADSLKDITTETAMAAYSEVLDKLIDEVFQRFPLSAQQKQLLRELGVGVLLSSEMSGLFTGLVFAGYGNDEIFPSLMAVDIDGIVCGTVKYNQKVWLDIDRRGAVAEIIPFAQKEMVDRFLYGVDEEIEKNVKKYWRDVVTEIKDATLDQLPRMRSGRKATIASKINKAMETAIDHYDLSFSKKLKEKLKQQIVSMISGMPKQELSAMAEALVSLTSLKRRVSAEVESVAGPIDVAVITRSEGLVWVRRKHYFPADLNPRFFQRKFGLIQQTARAPDGKR